MHFSTIILAGGQSSRMGSNKALMQFAGKQLIQYPIDLARSFGSDVFISANNHELDFLGIKVITDLLPVNAPLAGIHAGLKSSRADWSLVLTCDMPNVTGELINRLLAAINESLWMIVPRHDGFTEPLCGFYRRDIIATLEDNFLAGKLSLLDLPGSVPCRFIDLDDIPPGERALLFRNVNEKNDLLPFM